MLKSLPVRSIASMIAVLNLSALPLAGASTPSQVDAIQKAKQKTEVKTSAMIEQAISSCTDPALSNTLVFLKNKYHKAETYAKSSEDEAKSLDQASSGLTGAIAIGNTIGSLEVTEAVFASLLLAKVGAVKVAGKVLGLATTAGASFIGANLARVGTVSLLGAGAYTLAGTEMKDKAKDKALALLSSAKNETELLLNLKSAIEIAETMEMSQAQKEWLKDVYYTVQDNHWADGVQLDSLVHKFVAMRDAARIEMIDQIDHQIEAARHRSWWIGYNTSQFVSAMTEGAYYKQAIWSNEASVLLNNLSRTSASCQVIMSRNQK